MANLILYPNPSFGQVAVSSGALISHLEITDAVGEIVLALNPYTDLDSLDISHLASGVYQFAIVQDSQQWKKCRLLKL